MIPASDRKLAIELIDEAIKSGARQFKACAELNISERTYNRWKDPSTPLEDRRPMAIRPEPHNKISPEVKQEIIEVANSSKYKDLSPHQIVPRLLDDEERYIASESTMYRVLRQADMVHHRGRVKKPEQRKISTHKATQPNQVWMWDITWLPGVAKGFYFYLYLILDLYSRKIVGWEIWPEESSENASLLVKKTVLSEGCFIREKPLVLHSDNGSPMKGASLLETLNKLGITSSKSRPRVSNDNPYAESIFRTCKYRPGFPYKGFKTIDDARTWVFEFVQYYNYEHRHSGINYLTPLQRHNGLEDQILSKRKAIYETAKQKHPERWSGNIRDWSLDKTVWLNPPSKADEDLVKRAE